MALRGADIDPDALRAGGVVIYLNSFQRTRAWVGSDELSYAPGELVRGTAYLKNSPHHARRQLVLSQVDVYLSPECVRRKINNTYETKETDAKKQNLTEIYYTRRGGPRHNSYKSYYNYGETIPPRESPFRGPFQAKYHYNASRFTGQISNLVKKEVTEKDGDDISIASSNLSEHNSEQENEDIPIYGIPDRLSVGDPGPIRCCVFKASRDGGPMPLPATPYEAPFRFSLRIPDDAPENYAWAEEKPGCYIEIRYRLYVVFKLRAQPRDAAHADDPLYWQGAVRNGEDPLIVLFSESAVGVDPTPNSSARNDVYTKHVAKVGIPSNTRRNPKPKRRSFLGRRSLEIENFDTLQIGDELKLTVYIKGPKSVRNRESNSNTGIIKVELLEKAILRQGRKTASHRSARIIYARCDLDAKGEGAIVMSVKTENENLYPSAQIGTLVVKHALKVTLSPGERFSISAKVPLTLVGGNGRFLTRTNNDSMLYPLYSRQPPWRKRDNKTLEREKLRKKEISEKIEQLSELDAPMRRSELSTAGEIQNEECSICFDDSMRETLFILPCSHAIHEDCAKQWLLQRDECPVCHKPLV